MPLDLKYHSYQFTWVDHTDMAGKQLKIKGDNDEFLQVKENKIVSLTEFLFWEHLIGYEHDDGLLDFDNIDSTGYN